LHFRPVNYKRYDGAIVHVGIRVLREAVAGTRICGAGSGTRTVMRAGAGQAWDKNSLCRLLNVDSMHVKVT